MELSSVLEDLPVILSRLREGKASSIIFGSQATERTVHLVPGPEFVDMTCETWSKTWSPEPRTESIAAPVLEKMLVELGQICPARQGALPRDGGRGALAALAPRKSLSDASRPGDLRRARLKMAR